MTSLEEKLEQAFSEMKVSDDNQKSVNNFLYLLKRKDEATYEHSIRVGLLGVKIARHMHLDLNAMFYAGVLHDVGKAMIPPEVLKKTEDFNDKDMEQMRKHSEYTYNFLRGIHEFSAEVALRHHKYQERGYPEKMPETPISFSEGTKVMIGFYARLLALADFYDAVTTRENDRFGEKRRLTKEEAKKIILEKNPDQRKLIEDLYECMIFGNENSR